MESKGNRTVWCDVRVGAGVLVGSLLLIWLLRAPWDYRRFLPNLLEAAIFGVGFFAVPSFFVAFPIVALVSVVSGFRSAVLVRSARVATTCAFWTMTAMILPQLLSAIAPAGVLVILCLLVPVCISFRSNFSTRASTALAAGATISVLHYFLLIRLLEGEC